MFSIYREILGRNFCAAWNQHVTNSLFFDPRCSLFTRNTASDMNGLYDVYIFFRILFQEPFPTIYVDSKEEGEKFSIISQAQMKKITKVYQREVTDIHQSHLNMFDQYLVEKIFGKLIFPSGLNFESHQSTQYFTFQVNKAESKLKKEAEEAAKRAANLEESKSIVISEDPSLPTATASKINGLTQYRGQRVKVNPSYSTQNVANCERS